jgi:hypothetical protein
LLLTAAHQRPVILLLLLLLLMPPLLLVLLVLLLQPLMGSVLLPAGQRPHQLLQRAVFRVLCPRAAAAMCLSPHTTPAAA